MTIKKKLIGYGYTDSNGVATLDYDENGTEISTLAPTGNSGYIGKGVGSVQLEAGLHSSETVVSDPCTVFDCPVYDGDNTPTSISWSKTNNAIVTDEVVSLIASVLNTNNNPCINIPVVFKQGNTVLGTAYTDCNGDATMTYTWADSDIFDVTAQVGQSLSEDITMFVKDKLNLATHNQWTCGKLLNSINDFIVHNPDKVIITIENDGIHLLRTTTDTGYSFICVRTPLSSEDIGKDIILKSTCRGTGGSNVQTWFFKSDSSSINGGYVNVTNVFAEIIKTNTIPENTSYVEFRFVPERTADITIALNNIQIYIQ